MAHWSPQDLPRLDNRCAIVTGANSGLGYYTARALAAAGAEVILACRNAERGEAARAKLAAELPQARLQLQTLDLADLDSVAAFAQSIAAEREAIDILCNNAGVMALPLRRTAQGFEMQIGTNHLGHFALTGRLLPLLNAAPAGRIVNTASLAHRMTRGMDLDDLNWKHKRYARWDAYGKSKLANLLFTFELERRLRSHGQTAIAVAAHPGYAATHLQAAGPEMSGSRLSLLAMNAANAIFAQSAEQGAEPQIYAAAMPEVRGGDYWGPDGLRELRGHPRRVRGRRAAYDTDVSARLWDVSESLTGVAYLG